MKAGVPVAVDCYHCGEALAGSDIHTEGKYFCCQGCMTVYHILEAHDLCAYYDLNQKPGTTIQRNSSNNRYQFLDQKEIAQRIIKFESPEVCQLNLYIPQIHCSSCLYLLERIGQLQKGILESRVNFEKKEIFISYDPRLTSLREVVETLNKIGYDPHLSLSGETTGRGTYDKERLIKIGLAGFAFSNIMVFSLADYFAMLNEIDPMIKSSLQWFSLVLSIPVLLYAASEFFTSSYKAIKSGFINIDAPIALSLLITFGRSVYEITGHHGSGYLDSMSGIVFFMLVGRWFQSRTIASQSFDRDYKSFFPMAVTRLVEGKYIPTEVNAICEKDVIVIHSQEIIPVDAMLSKGRAEIDYSFVNGESTIQHIAPGQIIYAGARQTGGQLEMIVVKPLAQSYLTGLWNKATVRKQKYYEDQFYDRAGAAFGIAVLVIGLASFAYWFMRGDSQRMWNSITTVFIIACPCILLLAKTYTYGFFLSALNKANIYLRSAEILPLFSKLGHIVFDKTGTLTDARSHHVRYYGQKLERSELKMIARLVKNSTHPLSRAIGDFINIQDNGPVEHFKVYRGAGIEAWIDEHHVKIGSSEFVTGTKCKKSQTQVLLMIDGKLTGEFIIHNQYRYGISRMLKGIHQKYNVSVLSGDHDREAERLSKLLGPEAKLLFRQDPEQKSRYIQAIQAEHTVVMMIGDGLNDSNALQAAGLGVAVMNGNAGFTPAADMIMEAGMIRHLQQIISFAGHSSKVVRIIFTLSAIYNITGLYFAVQGLLSPVIAAILMPLTSLTILLLSYVSVQWLSYRHPFGEKVKRPLIPQNKMS